MEQIAQSEFFYHHIAPHIDTIYVVFFLGIFGVVGVVAQSVRVGLEAEEREELERGKKVYLPR